MRKRVHLWRIGGPGPLWLEHVFLARPLVQHVPVRNWRINAYAVQFTVHA